MISFLVSKIGLPLLLKGGGVLIGAGVLALIYNVHVSNLQDAAREEGRKEAVNAIAAQDDKFVAALRQAYARRGDCLRSDGMRWEQSTGQCVRR